jgi:hypothetical protein
MLSNIGVVSYLVFANIESCQLLGDIGKYVNYSMLSNIGGCRLLGDVSYFYDVIYAQHQDHYMHFVQFSCLEIWVNLI